MRPFALALAVSLLACSTTPPAPPLARDSTVVTAPAPSFPRHVLTAHGASLFLPEKPSVRIARAGYKRPVRILETRGEQVVVVMEGAVEVRGVTPLALLVVEVCEPGPLGERFFAGNDNLLTLRGEMREGRVPVAGEVPVRSQRYAANVPFREQFERVPFEAEIDVRRLCDAPQPPRHAGTEADPHRGTGYGEPDIEDFAPGAASYVDIEPEVPLALLDAPGGATLRTLPPSEWGYSLVRLRGESGHDQVAVGGGPYLLGWIPSRPVREPREGGEMFGLVGGLASAGQPGPHALHVESLKALPLHALPAGTTLQSDGHAHSRFVAPGWGRVHRTQGRWSLLTAAVDEDVVLYGWVETAKLGPAVEAAQH